MLQRNGMQILKLRSVELPKGPQKRVFFLIPHRLSPEEDKKKKQEKPSSEHHTIPHCIFKAGCFTEGICKHKSYTCGFAEKHSTVISALTKFKYSSRNNGGPYVPRIAHT